MSNPTPPSVASPRPVWAIVGAVLVIALVVAPLTANLRAGLGESAASDDATAAPLAEFASFDLESDQSSLPWPSAAEIEQYASAEQEARWERFVASLPPAPAPAPTPAPATAPPADPTPVAEGGEGAAEAPAAPGVPSDSVWDALAQCESNGNWAMNSGNGFYGGIQFMHSTWVNMGGRQWAEYPHQATREQQIEVATRLQAQYGWGQWPACSSKLGLR